jgi:hypothetical protein
MSDISSPLSGTEFMQCFCQLAYPLMLRSRRRLSRIDSAISRLGKQSDRQIDGLLDLHSLLSHVQAMLMRVIGSSRQ